MSSRGSAPLFEVAGFGVIRFPALSVEMFPDSDSANAGGRLSGDFGFEVPEAIVPALRHATPDLVREFGPDNYVDGAAARSVYKYLSRATWRSTPFGLVAGYANAIRASVTELTLVEGAVAPRFTLDPGMALELSMRIAPQLARAGVVHLVANPTVHLIDGRWRYHRATEDVGRLVSFRDGARVRAVIETARVPVPWPLLAKTLSKLTVDGVSNDDFLTGLVQRQILLPVGAAHLVGDVPFVGLQSAVAGLLPLQLGVDTAPAVLEVVKAVDRGPDADADELWRLLEGLEVKRSPRPPLHAVLHCAELMTIGDEAAHAVERAMALIHRIREPRPQHWLRPVLAEFEQKFGSEEIPFPIAADPDFGLDLRALLSQDDTPPWTRRDSMLSQWAEDAVRLGVPLELDRDRVAKLTPPENDWLPSHFVVLGSLMPRATGDVSHPYSMVLDYAIGPGLGLLGRFTSGDDVLASHVHDFTSSVDAEEPSVEYVEVVAAPNAVDAVFLARAATSRRQLAYNVASSLDSDRVIRIADTTLSVRRGELVLREASSGRRLMPVTTSAYAIMRPHMPTALRLLEMVTPVQVLAWDWGSVDYRNHLPRVTSGDLVLARERWTLRRPDWAQPKVAMSDQLVGLRSWCESERVPRWVKLVEGDNQLTLDLNDPLAEDILLRNIRAHEITEISELLPAHDDLVVQAWDGARAHEFVLPVRVTSGAREFGASKTPSNGRGTGVESRFDIASDWLFLKCYVNEPALEDVLVREIPSLLATLERDLDVSEWFFIRYADPSPHIRLRLRLPPERHGSALICVRDALLGPPGTRRVNRVALDSYVREIGRYGGSFAIEAAERVFAADSRAVLAGLTLERDQNERVLLAALGVETLLSAVGLTLDQKLQIVRSSRDFRSGSLDPNRPARHMFSSLYRRDRPRLDELLESQNSPAWPALAEAAADYTTFGLLLDELAEGELLEASKMEIAEALAHMHINRALRGGGGWPEVQVLDYLARTYQSQLARSAQQVAPESEPSG